MVGDRDANVSKVVHKAWPDACGNWFAKEPAVGVHSGRVVEDECILEGDNIAFHALNFRNVSYSPRSVAQPREVHYNIDG